MYPNISRFPNLRSNTLSHQPLCAAVAGEKIVTGGGSGDGLVWDMGGRNGGGEEEGGGPTATLEGHCNNVTGVAWVEWG